MIQYAKFRFLVKKYLLFSFTMLSISINPNVGSSCNFTRGSKTYWFILGYNCMTIRAWEGTKDQISVASAKNNGSISWGQVVIM